MADTVVPVTFAANYGYTAEPVTTVNAKIFQGSTSVYDHNVVVNLPVNAVDTIADFGTVSGGSYYSNTTALYTLPFSVSLASDADATNDKDTVSYRISDTTWSENAPSSNLNSVFYVHRLSPLSSTSTGTSFTVAPGRSDTLTSVSVAFDRATTAGQTVGVQIYHFDGTNWTFDGVTKFRSLAASEISDSVTIKYATFVVDYTASAGYVVLNGGSSGTTYAAVVKGQGNTADVTILGGENPAPYSIIGSVGVSDTSNNDGAATQQFGQTGLPSGESSTPLVSLNFGVVPPLAISNPNGLTNKIGAAYPNPANTAVTVPFVMKDNATVTVTLMNAIGQVISTQAVNAVGGAANKAIFQTAELPNGIYMYTVSADGKQATGKITIAH
jgi:hypothetical protein